MAHQSPIPTAEALQLPFDERLEWFAREAVRNARDQVQNTRPIRIAYPHESAVSVHPIQGAHDRRDGQSLILCRNCEGKVDKGIGKCISCERGIIESGKFWAFHDGSSWLVKETT